MIRISGPTRWSFWKSRLNGREKSISTKLAKIASTSEVMHERWPYCAENEIAMVIVPGPAISGAASGTIESSVKSFRSSFSRFWKNFPSRTAIQPMKKITSPPVILSE